MKDNTYSYYAGSMVYKNDKSLNYILTDEGLVNKVSGGYAYEYHLKDHLGNVRVTFQPNGTGTTLTQATEYYPFGMNFSPQSPAGTNKYLYNGKEKQDDQLSGTNLDLYDYGARFYDPMIGRWHTQDPLAELSRRWSPYNYGYDAPTTFIDADGMVSKSFIEDMWNNSNNGTVWINNDDGTFSSSTGKTIYSSESDPQNKIVTVNDENKNNISKVSWGETSGLYPIFLKNDKDGKKIKPKSKELFDASSWDPILLQQLLKSRAAINLIAGRNGAVYKYDPDLNDPLEKFLASYHLTNNFPEVDSEIKNDSDVKFYFLSSDPDAKTPAISQKYWNQMKVKSYGPFYSVGGGDAGSGQIYIHFYKAVKK